MANIRLHANPLQLLPKPVREQFGDGLSGLVLVPPLYHQFECSPLFGGQANHLNYALPVDLVAVTTEKHR